MHNFGYYKFPNAISIDYQNIISMLYVKFETLIHIYMLYKATAFYHLNNKEKPSKNIISGKHLLCSER